MNAEPLPAHLQHGLLERLTIEEVREFRPEVLVIPLHHQLRPWAMKTGVTTLHRADDRPAARFTSIK